MKSVLMTTLVFILASCSAFFSDSFQIDMISRQPLSLLTSLQIALIVASLLAVVVAVATNKKAGPIVVSPELIALRQELQEAKTKIAALEIKTKTPPKSEYVDATVLRFVGLLQERSRLVDFAMEDISQQPDERVGVVARIVHQGVREVLQSCFAIAPLHAAREGETVAIAGTDCLDMRIVGASAAQPQGQGVLLHRGWRAHAVNIARVTELEKQPLAAQVITPAEIRVS